MSLPATVDTNLSLVSTLCVAAILLLSWLAARLQKLRRAQALYRALNDSSHAQLVAHRRDRAGSFLVQMIPAPQPFAEFGARYQASSWLDPLDWARWLLRHGGGGLQFRGNLLMPPHAELLWTRGRLPSRALGVGPSRGLWVQHSLDFINAWYATRGANPAAIRHAFADMQTRFGAIVSVVSIQGDQVPQLEVAVDTRRLNSEDIPALVTTICALARAAQQG